MEAELTLLDYLTRPITELSHHPDFTPEAHSAALWLSKTGSTQLEAIHRDLEDK